MRTRTVWKSTDNRLATKTWAETTLDSAALDDIKCVVVDYLYLVNQNRKKKVVEIDTIIRIIEKKTGYHFADFDYGGPDPAS